MKGILEKKSGGTVGDVDVKTRRVTGLLSAFGNVDSDNDIFTKGAYSKTIVERKGNIFFLQYHDWSKPLGKFDVLEERKEGLYFEAEVVDTSFGLDQLKLYQAGIISEHSVGFSTMQSEQNKSTGVRTIKEVKLYEGSSVPFGANSETPFLGFKTAIKETNDKISKIMSVLKNGTLTDDTFIMLELALKQLQLQSYELGKKHSQEIVKPCIDTLEYDYEPLIKSIKELTI